MQGSDTQTVCRTLYERMNDIYFMKYKWILYTAWNYNKAFPDEFYVGNIIDGAFQGKSVNGDVTVYWIGKPAKSDDLVLFSVNEAAVSQYLSDLRVE